MPFNIEDIQETRAKLLEQSQKLAEQEAAIATLQAELDSEAQRFASSERNEEAAEASHESDADLGEESATPVNEQLATPAPVALSEEAKLRAALDGFALLAKQVGLSAKKAEVASFKEKLEVGKLQLDYYEKCAGHLVSLTEFNQMHDCQVKEEDLMALNLGSDGQLNLVSLRTSCRLDDCTEADFVSTVADHIQQRAQQDVISNPSEKSASFRYKAAVSNVNAYSVTTALAQKLSANQAFSVEDQSQVVTDALKPMAHVDLLVKFTNPLAHGARRIILAAKTCNEDHSVSASAKPAV